MRCPAALATLALMLALLTSLAPAAVAQSPCQIALDADVTEGATGFGIGETRSLTLTVSNQGNLDARVTVGRGTLPTGWATSMPGSLEFTVPSGDDAAREFTVTYEGSQASQTGATLGLDASATCGSEIIGQTTSTDAAQLQMTGVAPPPPPGPAEDPGSLWPFVIAGLVVIAVIGFGARSVIERRPPKVRARTDEAERAVAPARGTSFPLMVENQGAKPVNVRLQVKGLPAGWSGMLALPEVVLGPKEKRSLWVMVRAPEGVNPGEQAEFSVHVLPDEGEPREVQFRATVATE